MSSLSQVKQAHVSQSGFALEGPARMKEFAVVGTASAGQLDVFDSDSAPEAGVYTQSGTTVTVTDSSHGLTSGDIVGIAFDAGTGGTAAPGNYEITVTSANAFTVTVLNSITISGGSNACRYVAYTPLSTTTPKRWVMTKETGAGDTFQNVFQIPSGGFLARNNVYFSMTNLGSAEVLFE